MESHGDDGLPSTFYVTSMEALIMQFRHDYDHGFPWTFHRKFMESHGDDGFL